MWEIDGKRKILNIKLQQRFKCPHLQSRTSTKDSEELKTSLNKAKPRGWGYGVMDSFKESRCDALMTMVDTMSSRLKKRRIFISILLQSLISDGVEVQQHDSWRVSEPPQHVSGRTVCISAVHNHRMQLSVQQGFILQKSVL